MSTQQKRITRHSIIQLDAVESLHWLLLFVLFTLEVCSWNGKECTLGVHIDEGFTLFTEEMGVRKSILLQHPFERLRMSSDDGVRMMFLDFGGPEAEIVSHSAFLSTKKNPLCFPFNLFVLNISNIRVSINMTVCVYTLVAFWLTENWFISSFTPYFSATGPPLLPQDHSLHHPLFSVCKGQATGPPGMMMSRTSIIGIFSK